MYRGGLSILSCAVLLAFFGNSQLASGKALKYVSTKDTVHDQYIVVFHKNVTKISVLQHIDKLNAYSTQLNEPYSVLKEFAFDEFHGYAIECGLSHVEKLAEDPVVKYVEPNQIVRSKQEMCIQQRNAEWGLVRTNKRDLVLDGLYDYESQDGAGVDIYVLDTGIYLEHADFEGRAVWGTDTTGGPQTKTDENGHGTHVTGTLIGKTYGIAKKATAVAVKILDATGTGTTLTLLDGIDWLVANHLNKKATNRAAKSVANLSLGGPVSKSLNEAIDAAVDSGIPFVVAAGNEMNDACNTSPASALKAITVGCSDSTDTYCIFSNFGKCVDVAAPGLGISSAWIGGPFAKNSLSGTSMSSPHVAGIAANYMSQQAEVTPDQVINYLRNNATKDHLKNLPVDTPNNIVYMDCA